MKAQMYNYRSWVQDINPNSLLNYYKEKLINAGFGVERLIEKHFNPHGYTALFLLSESHFAIHTFPEEKITYIELSSCIKEPFDKFIKSI
jgi:S-adenosylmethionine decarboxylase